MEIYFYHYNYVGIILPILLFSKLIQRIDFESSIISSWVRNTTGGIIDALQFT